MKFTWIGRNVWNSWEIWLDDAEGGRRYWLSPPGRSDQLVPAFGRPAVTRLHMVPGWTGCYNIHIYDQPSVTDVVTAMLCDFLAVISQTIISNQAVTFDEAMHLCHSDHGTGTRSALQRLAPDPRLWQYYEYVIAYEAWERTRVALLRYSNHRAG